MIRLLLILFLIIGCEDSEKSTKLLTPSPTSESDDELIEYVDGEWVTVDKYVHRGCYPSTAFQSSL